MNKEKPIHLHLLKDIELRRQIRLLLREKEQFAVLLLESDDNSGLNQGY